MSAVHVIMTYENDFQRQYFCPFTTFKQNLKCDIFTHIHTITYARIGIHSITYARIRITPQHGQLATVYIIMQILME